MKPLPLMQFIPALSPRFHEPRHLAALIEVIERTEREPVHAVCSAPPRHEKSESIKHGLARRLRLRPQTRIAYVSYAASFAIKKSREIRKLYERAGGRVVEDANRLTDWRTTDTGTDDGGLWATSVGGPITGEGFDLIVIDDSTKSRAMAESGVEREKQIDWYRDTLSTREEPGASTLYVGARWTPYDLPSHLIADGFEHINLPAINAAGEALCPLRYPLSALARIRETLGEYGWQSLYMGEPYARGGALFQDVQFYDELPAVPLRIRIGVDFAYTKKTKSDHSVAVVLGELAGTFYVLEVIRQQVIAPEFKRTLDGLGSRYPGIRPFAFVGGTEKGVVDLMNAQGGIQIEMEPATQDKFLRAQGVAAQWNAGKVLLPRSAPWLDAFVSEVVSFTGSDVHDDQVDALAGAYERARVAALQAEQQAALDRRNENIRQILRIAAGDVSHAEFAAAAEVEKQRAHEALRAARLSTTQNETWQAREARIWGEFCARGGVETNRPSELIDDAIRTGKVR